MEYFDIYDKNQVKTGKILSRGSVLEKGEFILVTDALIVNSLGQTLIQKRTEDKSYCPGRWGLTGGSVLAGEKSREACGREIEEEIGIKVDMSKAEFLERRLSEKNQIYIDLYKLYLDTAIENMTMQTSEVAALKWVSAEELEDIIRSGQFMSTLIFAARYLSR